MLFQNIFTVYILLIKTFIYLCSMRIISHKKLRDFYEQAGNQSARLPLERWYEITEKSEWKNFADIKQTFPATDYVGNQHYVFNIGGNKYRLVVVVQFTISRVYVRYVGTHAEYDQIDCSTV